MLSTPQHADTVTISDIAVSSLTSPTKNICCSRLTYNGQLIPFKNVPSTKYVIIQSDHRDSSTHQLEQEDILFEQYALQNLIAKHSYGSYNNPVS